MSVQPERRPRGAHIIVLGNEKGGSGKSTTAMHVVVGLLHERLRVGCIDLDLRQATLSRYVANRAEFCRRGGVRLPMPDQIAIEPPEPAGFDSALTELRARSDVVVIDCPGHDAPLARRAHACADTLITPLNDSFIDFDVLARVDAEGVKVVRPSHYAEMVWEQRTTGSSCATACRRSMRATSATSSVRSRPWLSASASGSPRGSASG